MKNPLTFLLPMFVAACFCLSARADVMTFDSLTNDAYGFPIPYVGSMSLGDLMLTGGYRVSVHSVNNPNNGTRAIAFDSVVASNYVLALYGIRAPFVLKGFDVVSVTGSFILIDITTGARYTNNGTTGHITLGSEFDRVVSVDMFLNGQVTIDNIEFTLLEHRPVASLRVLNELTLPPIDRHGHSILGGSPPGHLENPDSYEYPGYRGYWHYVLAPGTNPMPFVVDASASGDTDGNPLTFGWSYYVGNDEGDWYPLAGGVASSSPYFTNQPPYLNNFTSQKMHLRLEDGYLFDVVWFGVQVLTPQNATDRIRGWLDDRFEDSPRRAVRQRLIPTLQRASTEFANGNTESATRSLKLFQHQVKVHLRKPHPRISKTMVAFSQAIIDVVASGNEAAP